jgi:adenine deaminase
MKATEVLAVARGDVPADLLFQNARIFNVLTGEVEEADVAVVGDLIAGVGRGYAGRSVVELGGAYLLPGFIDAHVHIESSMVTPPEFARAVIPRGTTTVVCDPHEIANVHGLDGIEYMLAASQGLPLSVLFMASSCVPATTMGTAGANLGATDLALLLSNPRVLGLAEVMNFPGVIHGNPEVLAKLDAFRGRVVDGHAPGVTGRSLSAYVAAGPRSDHECTTPMEAREKLRRGLFLFFREASNARNLRDLLPALTEGNRHRVALCTDDRQPPDLLAEGGIDGMVRTLVQEGLDPVEAVRLATLNPAEHFRLDDRGAVAPGRRADLLVVEDARDLLVRQVYAGGRLVAQEGKALKWDLGPAPPPPPPSMRIEWSGMDLSIRAGEGEARVIKMVPDQIVTESIRVTPTTSDGVVVTDPSRDLLKIAVLERHTGSGRVGLGLVSGMGLRTGAMAGTVAHDHHNLIAVGADDASMETAVREVARLGGGLAVAQGTRILSALALPVAGLMSEQPIEVVRRGLDAVVGAARQLGSPLHDPFMAMSFLALEVIPALKITDRGLVDVDRFEPVDLWV